MLRNWRATHADADYQRYGLLLLAIYLTFYGWMLIASNGLPFVMDANETYSAFWHAYNLYHFDFTKSLGLTDEAFSPLAAAHPFIHTHQGNMPRIFAFVAYALGAQTVQSQVITTTLVVGTLSVFVIYHFFSKTVNSLFAFIFTSILITDYILFSQWLVVTYRVWHSLLFFSALLAIHSARQSRSLGWLALAYVTYVLAFYFELVFAGLLTLTSLFYALFVFRRDHAALVRVAAASAAGAVTSVTVLVVQLVTVFGPEIAYKDFYYTFFARNATSADQTLKILTEFYSSHNIAFWFNIFDASPYRTLGHLVKSISTINLQTYTPVLVFFSFVALVSLLLAAPNAGRRSQSVAIASKTAAVRPVGALLLRALVAIAGRTIPRRAALCSQSLENRARTWGATKLATSGSLLRLVLVTAALTAAYIPVVRSTIIFGTPAGGSSFSGTIAIIIGLALALGTLAAYSRACAGKWGEFQWLDWSIALRLIGLAAAACAFALISWKLYEPVFKPIWMAPIENPLVRLAARLAAFASVFAGGLSVIQNSSAIHQQEFRKLQSIWILLFAGGLAYVIIYLLSPGYVLTGYQWRHTPFSVFTTNLLPAIGFYLLARGAGESRTATARLPSLAVRGVCAAGLVMAITYWSVLQIYYIRLLPPDHYAFLTELQEEPYRGKTFVVNNYAAPVAAMTGNWAYYDPLISGGLINRKTEDPAMVRDTKSYLWLADRTSNPAYEKPDYYICMTAQNFTTALGKLTDNTLPTHRFYGCRWQGLVASLHYPNQAFGHRLVSSDLKASDYWSILALDYTLPPKLRGLPGVPGPARVDAKLTGSPASPSLVVHVDAEPDVRGRVEVFLSPGKDECEGPMSWNSYLTGEPGQPISLPPRFSGHVLAFVTPYVLNRSGRRYHSPVLAVENGRAAGTCRPSLPSPPMPLFVEGNQFGWVQTGWADAYGEGTTALWAVLTNGSTHPLFKVARPDMHNGKELIHSSHDIPLEEISQINMQNCHDGSCSPVGTLPIALEIEAYRRENGIIEVAPSRIVPGIEYRLSASRQLDGEMAPIGAPSTGTVVANDPAPGADLVLRLENCRDGQCYAGGTPFLSIGSPPTASAHRSAPTEIEVSWARFDQDHEYRLELFDSSTGTAIATTVLSPDMTAYRFGSLAPQLSYDLKLRYCRESLCEYGRTFRVTGLSEPSPRAIQ